MNRIRRIFSFAVMAILAMLASPRAAALDPSRAITQYGLTAWQEGLPQFTVTALAQTPDRYLWIGTQEGLARFDGERFEVFDRRRIPELPSSWITSLHAVRDGTLWIGTTEGVARRLPDGRFEKMEIPSPLTSRIAEDSSGAIWFAGRDGLRAFRDGRLVPDPAGAAGSRPKGARAVAGGRGGGLWWVDAEGEVHHRNPDGKLRTWRAGQGYPSLRATAMAVDGEEGCWVTTMEGFLLRVDGDSLRVFGPDDGIPRARLSSVILDRQGNVWIGSFGGGLIRYARGRFDVLGPGQGLGDSDVPSLLEDADGNLLVGTQAAGLIRLRDVPLETIGRPEGITEDNVRAVLAERDGSVLVGTVGPGLWRVRNGVVQAEPTPGPLFSAVSSLLRDRSGALWIGTASRGLVRWGTDGKFTWIGSREGLSDTHVTALAEDREGTLWIGTEGKGVLRMREGRFLPPGPESAIDQAWVAALLPASDGSLWIGTVDLGLAQLQQGKLTRWRRADGFPSEGVAALYEDAAGNVWVGLVSGGLARIRHGRIQVVGEAQGLFDDVVLAIVEDRRGDLWLSSNRGVSRVARKDVEAVMDGRAPRVEVRVYARPSGMRSPEGNGGQQPSATLDGAGRVWVATTKGAAIFDPGRDDRPPMPPPVIIRAVEVDGVPLAGGRQLDVPPGSRRVAIQFAAPDFTSPAQLRYQYRLDGWDGEWVEADEQRQAIYTALPPGDYVLRARAGYVGLAPRGAEATVAIHVAPWLVQRPAFRIAAVVAALLAGWAVWRVRIRSLRRRQRELEAVVVERTRTLEEEKERSAAARRAAEDASRAKSSFLASMSHEIRTPMHAVLGLTDLVLDTHLQPEQRIHLELVRSSGRHLLGILDEVLDFSRIEGGGLTLESVPLQPRAVVEEAVGTVRMAAEAKKLPVLTRVDASVPDWVAGDPLRLRQVLINLLGNAVKFTPTGEVRVVVAPVAGEPGMLEFRVEDTGPGIPAESVERIFESFRQAEENTARRYGGTGLGLTISRRLVDAMGGVLTLESEKGRGSTFRFTARLPETDGSGTRATGVAV